MCPFVLDGILAVSVCIYIDNIMAFNIFFYVYILIKISGILRYK